MKAIWGGEVVAESGDTVVVEGNHYFPASAINQEFLVPSDHTSYCPWKGTANYYSITVGDRSNDNAAWYYSEPKEAASSIKNRVAFWKGVEIVE